MSGHGLALDWNHTLEARTQTGIAKLLAFQLTLTATVIAVVSGCSRSKAPDFSVSFNGSSQELKATEILATLDAPIPPGKNAIWCAPLRFVDAEGKTNQVCSFGLLSENLNDYKQRARLGFFSHRRIQETAIKILQLTCVPHPRPARLWSPA